MVKIFLLCSAKSDSDIKWLFYYRSVWSKSDWNWTFSLDVGSAVWWLRDGREDWGQERRASCSFLRKNLLYFLVVSTQHGTIELINKIYIETFHSPQDLGTKVFSQTCKSSVREIFMICPPSWANGSGRIFTPPHSIYCVFSQEHHYHFMPNKLELPSYFWTICWFWGWLGMIMNIQNYKDWWMIRKGNFKY